MQPSKRTIKKFSKSVTEVGAQQGNLADPLFNAPRQLVRSSFTKTNLSATYLL